MTGTQEDALLVQAVRMLERAEMIDHSGHASMRDDDGRITINDAVAPKRHLTEADLVRIDLDGRVLEGSGRPPLEFHIHTEIYRRRPDVRAIIHLHPRWSTLLTMVGAPYRPVFAQGALPGEVPVMDDPMSINTRAMGEALAASLGDGAAVLQKAHGATVVAGDIVACFALAAYLEENAQRQVMALQIGTPFVFDAAQCRAVRARLATASLFRKTWDHYGARLA
jgi:ribulose-5-phosphate 4-epimerase/fuculose-1-phosphate aldolase